MPIGCAQEDGALSILIERAAQIKADADERLESYLWGEGAVVSTGTAARLSDERRSEHIRCRPRPRRPPLARDASRR